MAATIGALMVDIGANVARLQHDMDRAKSTFSRSANQIKRTARVMAGVIGASFSVAKIISAGKDALQAADNYAKMSRAVGISVESLSALDHVAGLSGLSFEKLTAGARLLSKNMYDFSKGTGEAKIAFQGLGIDVVDSTGKLKQADSVMLEIADRFTKMENGPKKTALAMRMFGESGAAMIPMLNNGSDGIRQMMEEAERLGIVFDTSTAHAAERINDQFDRMNKAMTGLRNGVLIRLLPDIENLSNIMFAAASNTGELDYVAKILSTTLKLLMSAGTGVTATFTAVGSVFGALAASIYSAATGDVSAAMNILKMAANDVADTYLAAWDRIENIWAVKMPQAADVVKTQVVRSFEEIVKTTSKTQAALEAQMSGTAQLTEQYVTGAFDNATSSIVEFATTGKASFKDFANSIIQDMMRIYFRQQIMGPLMNGVLGAFGAVPVSGASNLEGGNLYSGATAGEMSSFFSRNASGNAYGPAGRLTAFARGGIVNSPTMFSHAGGAGLMGEAGPEAIMPLTRIGGKLGIRAQGGGGNTINHHTFQIDARGSSMSPAEFESIARQATQDAYQMVYDDVSRRGPIRRSLEQ